MPISSSLEPAKQAGIGSSFGPLKETGGLSTFGSSSTSWKPDEESKDRSKIEQGSIETATLDATEGAQGQTKQEMKAEVGSLQIQQVEQDTFSKLLGSAFSGISGDGEKNKETKKNLSAALGNIGGSYSSSTDLALPDDKPKAKKNIQGHKADHQPTGKHTEEMERMKENKQGKQRRGKATHV